MSDGWLWDTVVILWFLLMYSHAMVKGVGLSIGVGSLALGGFSQEGINARYSILSWNTIYWNYGTSVNLV